MSQRRLGTGRTGVLTWRDRAGAVVATVLAATVAIGAATVGLVVGAIALVVLVPLTAFGVIRLRRLMRQAAAEVEASSRGRGGFIDGEFEVVGGEGDESDSPGPGATRVRAPRLPRR